MKPDKRPAVDTFMRAKLNERDRWGDEFERHREHESAAQRSRPMPPRWPRRKPSTS